MGSHDTQLREEPPVSDVVTDYDMKHGSAYLRLLDAAAEGADWSEAASIVLGLDPAEDPERARHVHDSHLERARWMTRFGYRDLLSRAP